MMKKHIDITFDFETVGTMPDAAPMQLAAVVWDRFADGASPFLGDSFMCGIDLRSCVMAGFSFDNKTVEWWSKRDCVVQMNVMECEGTAFDTAFFDFCTWINNMKKKYEAQTVCLWCQGQDFDFPILKTMAEKTGTRTLPVDQHWFRDCRTVVLETVVGLVRAEVIPRRTLMAEDIMEKHWLAYEFIPKMPEELAAGRGVHDALYDCMRSSWNTWWCLGQWRALGKSRGNLGDKPAGKTDGR